MKPKLIFSNNEYYNYSEGVALELGIPYQKVQDGDQVVAKAKGQILIFQNPQGYRATASSFLRNPEHGFRAVALVWERVAGKHERNNYGKEFLEIAPVFDDVFFSCEEDVEWGKAHGMRAHNAGVGWIASSCRRDIPREQKQDKVFWCGTIHKWWGDDLEKRIEAVNLCRELGVLHECTSRDPQIVADEMASCKVVLCPEGHCGYQSLREAEAALAGSLILAYEGEKESRWPFNHWSSWRCTTRKEFLSELNNPRLWLTTGEICSARHVVKQLEPKFVLDRILKALENT